MLLQHHDFRIVQTTLVRVRLFVTFSFFSSPSPVPLNTSYIARDCDWRAL